MKVRLHEAWLFFPPEISKPSFPRKRTRSSVWSFSGPLLAQGWRVELWVR